MTTTRSAAHFSLQYQTHLKHLKLKGLQPKTIEAYSRAIRRIGDYFDQQIDHLTESQPTNYFTELLGTHSWSAVKLDLYGLKFYYAHAGHARRDCCVAYQHAAAGWSGAPCPARISCGWCCSMCCPRASGVPATSAFCIRTASA